jgi:hypothetical protein
MGYYAASSGKLLPTFRELEFLTLADVTDSTSRNVGKILPLLAGQKLSSDVKLQVINKYVGKNLSII